MLYVFLDNCQRLMCRLLALMTRKANGQCRCQFAVRAFLDNGRPQLGFTTVSLTGRNLYRSLGSNQPAANSHDVSYPRCKM
ncbi:MAG: hypothetical protein CMJ75_07285 [Planctomycetaceae bacterium]|nr:hypothetical protein [Planctomycetaceae bacterium]